MKGNNYGLLVKTVKKFPKGKGFGRWERKGRVMGVLKGWKAGEIGGNYPTLLKICNRKKAK